MIRHLFELAVLLLLFGVGIGLLIAFGAGLLLVWKPESKRSQTEEEYRRVEGVGMLVPIWDLESGSPEAIRRSSVVPRALPHPYDWAKREPMIWQRPR